MKNTLKKTLSLLLIACFLFGAIGCATRETIESLKNDSIVEMKEQPAEQPAAAPEENQAEIPAEEPAKEPAAEKPAEEPAAEEPAEEPAAEEPAEELGKGSVDYKGMTVSFEQTGNGSVELHFDNSGEYTITLWFSNVGDFGFTVVGEDESGRKQSVVVSNGMPTTTIAAYSGKLDAHVDFSELSGKITSIRILNVEYHNTTSQFDFNNSQMIEIKADR